MSIDQSELTEMIKKINEALIMKGTYKKNPSKNEKKTKKLISRFFYSKKFIKKGDKISSNCINFLRTDEKINEQSSNLEYFEIINSIATHDIEENKMILRTDICQI